MPTSSDSGGLFISSSPLGYPTNPTEEVEVIFEQARQINTINPDIDAIVSTHRNAFTMSLSRQVRLIESRSQAWKDGRVTVFDKVLLKLTRNGKELDTPAAITYFCKEYLGISDHTDLAEKNIMLVDAVVASAGRPNQGEMLHGTVKN